VCARPGRGGFRKPMALASGAHRAADDRLLYEGGAACRRPRRGMAPENLPVLIVGDVHGDFERLFAALKPYPADRWHTVFLGDLADYGMFGVGCLRFARDRTNTDVLLGNHEAAMLWALRDSTRIGFWMSIGGQRHDLDELRSDEPLQRWLRGLPSLIRLPDRTLLQHCGNDGYLSLISLPASDPVTAINE